MARSSLVHYIIPSAISITPNCNSSVSDLAVYVARGTKIKVNSKKAGIDTAGGSYQEWVLTGRNRRLADSTVPYTIYARLRKTDKTDGYLMFVPQQQVSGEWKDKYPYVTIDGLYRDVYGSESSDYYYVRLGDVTLPGADGREVILDTGILGTEQYNEEWNLNPDNLPVRVDIGCTIDDEDAGPTPYVYFGKTLVLTASLQEGWSDTDVERFDHWEIARNTGDATADAAWPSQERQAQFAESGTIDLVHTRDDDDDFNGAVSGIFTVTAWGLEDDSSGTPAPVVIATASISIMAETVEKYDLQLSANIVSYSPQTGAYTPADGVKVAIRATDQRGDVFNMTNQQVQSGRLSADYAPVDSSDWTPLVFSGGAAEEAQATIPISAFSSEQGLKVRLLRTVDASTGEVMEMTNATIAFVRDGEDSKEREWIFQHTLTVTTYGDEHSEHPRPSAIDGGEVKPSGVAGGDDHNKDQDGWVPQGWCDNPQGIDETYQFEYGSYRDFIHSDSSGSSSGRGGHWGEFTEPRIWNHYAGDAVTYDIVPSVSVINADAAGTVTSDGIIVRAYQTKGSERSENILPNSDYPESGDYYFAEYSVDGGEWTRCEAFDYPAAGGTVIPVYGIPADAVRTATEGITIRLKHSSDITFVLKENTPIKVLRVISEDEVSDMVQELGKEEFLSRLYDDFASGEIGFLKGLWVKAKNLYGISEDGDARLHDTDISGTAHVGEDLNIDGELHGISAVLNKIVSSEYTGDGMLDTGFLLQYAEGRAKLVVDDLVARGKFTVNELETRIWTYAGGNMIFSGAGSTVFFVEYLDADENILGYTSINAPWLLNGRPLLSAMVAWSKRRSVQRSLTDEEKASVVKFRCYEYSDDGTMQTRNWWHVNDLALCQTLNKVKDKADSDGSYSGYASNTVYHRRVAGIGSKKIAAMGDDRVYDYVDLWNIYDVQGQTYIDAQGQEKTITDDVKGFLNMAPTGQAPSTDWPAAGDVIVQVGNPLDTDRQGAVTIEVQGDTHGLKVYDTISGYSMENKLWVEIGYDQTTGKAKANVYGDFRFGCRQSEEQGGGSYVKYNRTTGQLDIRANVHFTSPTTHTPTTLDNFASAVVGDLENLQSQIDGQIESWFYNYSPVTTDSQGVPTSNVPLNVAPYSEWTTDALKIAHLNDTFTNNKTGYCWRFSRNAATNAFEWVIIEDSAVIKALQDAAKAQDTADHKRRVFICDADNQTPVPPYDPGDLWVNVKYPWATGATYNNEILKCDKAVPRTEGGQEITGFNINDWSLSNGYTSKLNNFLTYTYAPFVQDISQQVDKKAETFRQATDPSSSWTADDKPSHVGDIWMDISANGGNKTYIYTDKGADADPRYVWEEQAVPDEVFDEIDGKAEIFVQKPTEYMERDLWIIESGLADTDMPAGCKAGDIVVADNMPSGTTKRTSYVKGDWRKKDRYTDDTYAHNFDYLSAAMGGDTEIQGGLVLSNTIVLRTLPEEGEDVGEIMSGVNGVLNPLQPNRSIAAWYGGDMEDKEAAGTPDPTVRYAKSLFRMDGSGYLAKGNISWDNNGNATFKGTISAGTTITDYEYLQTALGGDTSGLVLANQIAVKNGNNIMAGMSGVYNAQSPGGGIAGWYGGTKNDRENAPEGTDVSAYAKTLFRMDGTGYVASGNISWNASGDVTIQGTVVEATTKIDTPAIFLNGTDITATLNAILDMFEKDTTTQPGTTLIKAKYSLYSVGDVSALGNSSGGGGGGGGASVLYELNDVLANAGGTSVLDAQAGYVLTCVENGGSLKWKAAPTAPTYVLPAATSGALGGIKIGYTDSTVGTRNYAVALDNDGKAYVNVPWEDHTYTLAGLMGSTAKGGVTQPIYWDGTEFKNTTYTLGKSVPADAVFTDHYDWNDITHKPSFDYLPLGGGEMAGNITVKTDKGISIGSSSARVYYEYVYRILGVQSISRTTDNSKMLSLPDKSGTLAVTDDIAWSNVSSKPSNLFCYQGDVSTAYVNGTTYSTLDSGTYYIQYSGYSDSLIHFQHGGSSSGLDIKFNYNQSADAPLYYRKCIDSNRFAGTDWVALLDSLNSSVSKSGSTLTVKINGTEKSLENTWRGIQDNLTSDSTSDSLSAKQGKLLKGYVDTLNGYFDASGNAKSALKLTTVSKTAWGQTFWTSGGVPDSIDGNMSNVGNISFSASGKKIGGFLYFDTTNKRLGVDTSSPSYKLHVSGDIYATGDVTAASDQRKKEFVEDVVLTLEQIANAPAVKFRWKDDRDDLVHVGTYAQYWLDILPESVSDRGGELGFTYGNTALVAVKNLARYVMQLEEEIRQLKKEQNKSA